MSVILFKLFVNSLKQNLPSLQKRPGLQIRLITAMDTTKINIEDQDIELKNVNKETELTNKLLESEKIVRNKNCTRYKQRFMKRQWENTFKKEDNEIKEETLKEDGETVKKKVCETFERIKRKKVVLLLGYCGVDYFGMQRNPGVRTIEEDLLKALFEAKYITEDDFKNQQNAQFQRSSRTDKGVSAARQVVSLKLPLEIDIEEINKRLPESIKVFGVKRVTNKFNSKGKCNARTYSYTLPTYTFESSLIMEEERKQYRITAEKLEQVNNILAVYKGTKNYHNFTEKKYFNDPSASRYMMSFSVEKVFVESDMEFAVLLVKGQSFMLHQIRKMVGLMIAILRGHTDTCTLESAFSKEKVMIPTAPGLGLVLDMVHYDRYDARYKDSHESLTWEAEEPAVEKFKQEQIYPIIVKEEIEGNSMGQWLDKLTIHSYVPSEDIGGKETDVKTDVGISEKETIGESETNISGSEMAVINTDVDISEIKSVDDETIISGYEMGDVKTHIDINVKKTIDNETNKKE